MGFITAQDVVAFKRPLLKRVFNYTLQRPDTGLVTEFGEKTRWIGKPPEERHPGDVSALHEFLKRITIPPLKEDLRKFFAFCLEHKGQPQSVRALNTIERMEGKAGNWHDPLSGPRPENP